MSDLVRNALTTKLHYVITSTSGQKVSWH